MTDRNVYKASIVVLLALMLAACTLPGLPLGETEEPVEVERTSAIAGRVWHDICAAPGEDDETPLAVPAGCVYMDAQRGYMGDGVLMAEEPGIQGVEVTLGEGTCPSTGAASTVTAADGLYLFAGLAEGTYCVRIDPTSPVNASILLPGSWTYPTTLDAAIEVTVVLGADEIRSDLYFGWDYEFLPAYEAPEVTPTEAVTPTPTQESVLPPTEEPTSTPTATPVPEDADPRLRLGDPDWVDTFDGSTYWPVYSDGHVSFTVEDENLILTAFNPDYWNGWILPAVNRIGDFYLEMTAVPEACSGRDAFGMVIRASTIDAGQEGYLFGISCDGRYSLRQWDGENLTKIVDWTPTDEIQPGGDETYRIGIMADGGQFTMYINGVMVHEISHGAYDEGMFGVFVSSAQTPNFSVTVEEMDYWLLP